MQTSSLGSREFLRYPLQSQRPPGLRGKNGADPPPAASPPTESDPMKTTALLSCISGLALSLACASTKDGSSVTLAAAGMPGTAGSPTLVVGSEGGGGSTGTGAKEGGILTLTPEQVAAINNNACDGWSAEPESIPSVLEFVVDTSLSMNEVPGASTQPGQPGRPNAPNAPATGPTKWQSTRDALKSVISGLPETLAVGLLFYPNMANQARTRPASPDTCVNTAAGIAPAPLTAAQKSNLIAALDATNPNGWTPTDAAYQFALQSAILPTRLPGDKYMLLITDGQPTLRGDCTSAGNNAGIAPVEIAADHRSCLRGARPRRANLLDRLAG